LLTPCGRLPARVRRRRPTLTSSGEPPGIARGHDEHSGQLWIGIIW
jgi:hypothetical protein